MKGIKKILKKGKRGAAGILAAVMLSSVTGMPIPAQASDIWPQKATAPFYCLDGGKSWRQADRYDIYKYDTLPAPLTDEQARRLFWAYPSNWNALKQAASKYDPELYSHIASTVSGPNEVKRIKDSAGTKFAWVADNPDIEARAIAALEQEAASGTGQGNEAPGSIREATSEETAMPVSLPPFSDGPGALDTEIVLGSRFIRDIAKIEPQSVWDNGSTGGAEGWLDASQDKNIASSVMGESLYEVTWSGESIKIHNNGSATANENALGSELSEEEKYNKTMVRYKITMRKNSGWYTEGSWNDDYLHQWMDFKACVNAPDHQRLYKADIRITPSDMVFYMVISQGEGGAGGEIPSSPEYGIEAPEVTFEVFRHEETFLSTYNVKLKKLDDETGMPLKGSQFYLYERFEDAECIGDGEEGGSLSEKNISFKPWEGFQIFAEGITDEKGEVCHTDKRTYTYSKTYCDGHAMPEWAEISGDDAEEGAGEDPGEDSGEDEKSEDEEEAGGSETKEQAADMNRAAAQEWLDLVNACEEYAEAGSGTHFHWMADDNAYDTVCAVLESGIPETGGESTASENAFEASGCKADCEETRRNFIQLKFTYTWKEIQARTGYILHDIHPDDVPVELVTTVSSEAGAAAVQAEGHSCDISETIWYGGDNGNSQKEKTISVSARTERNVKTAATPSNAAASFPIASPSNAEAFLTAPEIGKEKDLFIGLWSVRNLFASRKGSEEDAVEDGEWEAGTGGDFESCLESAVMDGIRHMDPGEPGRYSHYMASSGGSDFWIIRDHRTEGVIHINKRDRDLYMEESEKYSSYGDTEGDGTLEGAVYGLFAAEDIVHPDTDILGNGTMSNTGIVYKMHDLTAVAVTDQNGDAEFSSYTVAPGMTYDHDSEKIVKRTDINWTGPINCYQENYSKHGSFWIERPLILGKYYIKELSRSEGYELSVNGLSAEWSNSMAGLHVPDSMSALSGSAVVSMEELTSSMEGEDGSGKGCDQLPFSVSSSGTGGYTLYVSGLPENTEFYRVDSGEQEVTALRVTGTEEIPVKDADGKQVWVTAETDSDRIKYQPEYGEDGSIAGQIPLSREESQIVKAYQIPRGVSMKIERVEIDEEDPLLEEKVKDHDLGQEDDLVFRYLKAETERILRENGYGTPVTAKGICSTEEEPVFSRGVKRGEIDIFGMTTEAGEPAVSTYYGAAVKEFTVEETEEGMSVRDVLGQILSWYQENPEWSFGGLETAAKEEAGYRFVLYAGASARGSRRFFTMREAGGKSAVHRVYTVLENPMTLRWMYQEYGDSGKYRYQIDRQYYFGGGAERRYYIDATLTPAVLADETGEIQDITHHVMVYYQRGEEIQDYLEGDPQNGYKVPLTELTDRMEVTTEMETVETDVRLTEVVFDPQTGIHRIRVQTEGTDSHGKPFSDRDGRLTLSFMAKLPEKQVILSEEDIQGLGSANVHGYQAGEQIGYGEYLVRFQGASMAVSADPANGLSDTYIMVKHLVYRGQRWVKEDGTTGEIPVQVLERPIKQKVKIIKDVMDEEAIGNFRFKIYLKSNLERLFCNQDGEIFWTDKDGNTVTVSEYRKYYPELVQKIYTEQSGRMLLEKLDEPGQYGSYNYEKFFDAIRTANTDKWKREGELLNSSFKPFAYARDTGIENRVNSSDAARENAARSDAVRQFAVDWYLREQVKKENGNVIRYSDEVYDKALYKAILEAEEYLKPFFRYDLDSIYSIAWDSERSGGIDGDKTTLSAWQIQRDEEGTGYAFGISHYLPYGEYVIAEQQPYKAEWLDFENRHYKIDVPKEISLPAVYAGTENEIPEEMVSKYPSESIPWSVTEANEDSVLNGFVFRRFLNRRYKVTLRIEKLDKETGEPILHDDGVFALYKAERNEDKDGDGTVRRYEKDTVIRGSRPFLEAMGASDITPFARILEAEEGAGGSYYGTVPAGTPICREKDRIMFLDEEGTQTGIFCSLPTVYDGKNRDILEVSGYLQTPEPVPAGVYVLAELKAPAGYVRSKPVPVEVYSDRAAYYPDGKTNRISSVMFEYAADSDGSGRKTGEEAARIFIKDEAVSLEISKKKTEESYRGMKVAGSLRYLENRRAAGEHIELVYENGVFQGYGYLIRSLNTAEDENRYVAGAKMALFEAIDLRLSGDREDYAFEGVKVIRDRNGNVSDIVVEEGYSGTTRKLIKSDGIWALKEISQGDTSVLFYDLGGLKVLEKKKDGSLYGYGKDGGRIRITSDTSSIYAMKGGRAVFEINGGDFSKLVYDERAKAFTAMDEKTVIYHLNDALERDSQTDGYTGLAYVEKSGTDLLGRDEKHVYVWPVTILRDGNGKIIRRDKVLTGRPGEVSAGTEGAYCTGTWNSKTDQFEKQMSPVFDEYGLVRYYPESDEIYKTGEPVYDRDGEYLTFRYEDLLEEYNRASCFQFESRLLYPGNGNGGADIPVLKHRKGESWIIPNIWFSGTRNPQDPMEKERTWGKPDLLRRVEPGTYILEEMEAPSGYVRAFPVAVRVKEAPEIQRIPVINEKIKVEIHKTDETDRILSGAKLALFRARRVYTTDFESYPKGYFLVKSEETPACWETEDPVDNHPVKVSALWITDQNPRYFEGIPAGDYILEELETPSGYLPSSMEITVKETSELQSFVLRDGRIKIEIFKYETDENTVETALCWPYRAELALYPAILDERGEVKLNQGEPMYDADRPVDRWISGRLGSHGADMTREYERMFSVYRNGFRHFSWNSPFGSGYADLLEDAAYGNGEIVTQIWELEDGSRFSVTVTEKVKKDLTGLLDEDRYVFEYRIHLKSGDNTYAPEMESYDTADGIHRIEGIPAGKYVLVETKTPDGYETAEPVLICVGPEERIQRYSMENKRKHRYVDKKDEYGNQIAGAELSLYRSDENGEFKKADELLIDRWISGSEGRYQADDLAEGKIPEGYMPGDMRLHELPPVGDGVYYLSETMAPDYFLEAGPEKIVICDESASTFTLVNRMAKGKVRIRKTDAEWYEKPLSGAWFEGKNLTTGDTFQMVTDENGIAESPELPVAFLDRDQRAVAYEYQIREIRPPFGYRLGKETWKFSFAVKDQDIYLHEIKAENQKTRLYFSKSDFGSGRLVKGARLAVYDAVLTEGKYIPGKIPVETWISGSETYQSIGKLSAGGIYFLVEEEAPKGYLPSPPVMFVISPDGCRILAVFGDFRELETEEDEETGKIKALSVMCRSIFEVRYVLKKGDQILSEGPVTGNIGFFAPEHKNEILTISQWIKFSDGTEMAVENETFRVHETEDAMQWRKVRLPIKIEYSLTGTDNGEIASWDDGEPGCRKRVEQPYWPAGVYMLEEKILFDDGSQCAVRRMDIGIGQDGKLDHVDIKDRQTDVRIKKTDMATGDEIPGAVLSIMDQSGKVIDTWISGDQDHILQGILEQGSIYYLSETSAPDGYLTEESIQFQVSEDGRIDRVHMEDRKKDPETPEEPKEPETPKEPEMPEEPLEPEIPNIPEYSERPQRPVETPDGEGPGQPIFPQPELEIPKRRTGIITAVYEPSMGGKGFMDLRYPARVKGYQGIHVPGTGDKRNPALSIAGLILSLLASGICIVIMRGKERKEEGRKSEE